MIVDLKGNLFEDRRKGDRRKLKNEVEEEKRQDDRRKRPMKQTKK